MQYIDYTLYPEGNYNRLKQLPFNMTRLADA